MFKFLEKLFGTQEQEKKPVTAAAQIVQADLKPVAEDTGIEISRLELLQRMWGDGFSSPGNTEYVVALAKVLLLDAQKSVLSVSSGLGGFDRTIATTFKTYLTGFERDKELATAGMAKSAKAGFSKHAPITHYDPEQFTYPKKVDAIICRELLYTIANKNEFIGKLAGVLKPRGQIIITDFTCEDPDKLNRPPVSLWMASEPYSCHPVPVSDITKILEDHGFDVRVSEDMSKPYIRQMLIGLSSLVKFLEGKKLNHKTKALLLTKVDRYARLVGALETEVRNTRFYAIKKH